MGIIALPFLLGGLIIGLYGIVRTIMLIKSGQINISEIILGFFLTWALLGLIAVIYIIEEKAWALSTIFRIPTFMIFIPFIIHLIYKSSKIDILKRVSGIILVSIGFTTIFAIVFNDLFFKLADKLEIEKYY